MSRDELIKETVEKLRQLSDSRIQEVSDYVSFLASKIDDKIISEGINDNLFIKIINNKIYFKTVFRNFKV